MWPKTSFLACAAGSLTIPNMEEGIARQDADIRLWLSPRRLSGHVNNAQSQLGEHPKDIVPAHVSTWAVPRNVGLVLTAAFRLLGKAGFQNTVQQNASPKLGPRKC